MEWSHGQETKGSSQLVKSCHSQIISTLVKHFHVIARTAHIALSRTLRNCDDYTWYAYCCVNFATIVATSTWMHALAPHVQEHTEFLLTPTTSTSSAYLHNSFQCHFHRCKYSRWNGRVDRFRRHDYLYACLHTMEGGTQPPSKYRRLLFWKWQSSEFTLWSASSDEWIYLNIIVELQPSSSDVSSMRWLY